MDQNTNQGNTGERRTAAANPARNAVLLVLGWISAIASVIIYPYFIFGLFGVIMGIIATKGGSRGGVAVIVANIVFMGIGMIFGGVISNNLGHLLGI